MTIRQLQYFAKIYECGNLLKASELLYLSQQALSRSLSALEQEIGMLLFYRGARGVTPTATGTELYHASAPVLREMARLEDRIQELAQFNSGQLRVGLAAGARYLNVRSLWRHFQDIHPNIAIQVQEYPYAKSLEMLQDNQLDLITLSDYQASENYVQYPIKAWNRSVVIPEEHPLSSQKYIEPKDFKGEHLVLYTNLFMKQQFLQYCQVHDCQPAEVISVNDALYLYETCQRERVLGITIQGYFSAIFSPQFPSLCTLPFKGDFLPYTVSVIARKDHPMGAIIKELTHFLQNFLDRV